jgi:hypothetical protein
MPRAVSNHGRTAWLGERLFAEAEARCGLALSREG